jgi:iron complex outermembrane receptor protein
VNVAAFYSDFRNIQVRAQQPGNITIILQNAAAARIYGIDSDVSAIITEDLRLQLGFSWIHGRYEDFQRAEIYVPLAAGGNRSTVADVTGNRLPRTPEFSGNVNIAYDHTYSDDSHIYGNTNLYLTDDIYWEPSNRIRTKAYGVLNGTLGYTFPGGVVSVELFGRNLTDRRYANYVVPSANADRTSYAPPRTFGVRALFRK